MPSTETAAEYRKLQRLAIRITSSYSDEFATCRDMRHIWGTEKVVMSGDQAERSVTCGQCGTVRTEFFNRFGRLVRSTQYAYPEGYRLSGTRLDRSFWRSVAFLRAANDGDVTKLVPWRRS